MASQLDPLSCRPLTTQVMDDLRRRIEAGELRPGDPLPPESGLMAEYGVSRITARNAVAGLRHEGLIVTRQGHGSFVRPAPHRTVVSRTHPDQLILATETITARTATRAEQARLDIPPGSVVLVVSRCDDDDQVYPADRVALRYAVPPSPVA